MDQTQRASGGAFVDVAGVDLAFRRIQVAEATPSGKQVLASLGVTDYADYALLQWQESGDVEEIGLDEPVNMSGVTAPRLIFAKADRTYRLALDGRSISWPAADISETALRRLGAVPAGDQICLEREEERALTLESGAVVSLRHAGVEKFFARAESWMLNVQGVIVRSPAPVITVRRALQDAGFDINTAWIIVLKTATERRQVGLDQEIDLREPGIEKLRLTPREINNGDAAAPRRRDFALLPADEAWLTQRGFDWSTVLEGGRRWLHLRDVSLPRGYTLERTNIAMEIPTAYPMAEVDMFYCYPHLACADGHLIPQTQVIQPIAGLPYQRWSRHRGPTAPWRPGVDSVVSHMVLIDESLNREVER